jgi:prepilin-type N-terminal cleavage/methylation domain-containing protein
MKGKKQCPIDEIKTQQNGYTLIELLIGISLGFIGFILITLIYVVAHFLMKHW